MKTLTRNRLLIALQVSTLLLAGTASAFDLNKNPGCGVTGLSKEQKIERNRNLAEYYYQAYVQGAKTGHLESWSKFNCWADKPTLLVGVLDPFGKPQPYPGNPNSTQGGDRELQALRKALPDFGGLPNTFMAYPAENGVMWRQVHGGHDANGKLHTIWEVCYIGVNDAGKITHYETWVDSIGMDKAIKMFSGKSMEGMSPQEYMNEIGKATKDAAPATQK